MYDYNPEDDIGPWMLSLMITVVIAIIGSVGAFVVWLAIDPQMRLALYILGGFGATVCLVRLFIWWWHASRRWAVSSCLFRRYLHWRLDE